MPFILRSYSSEHTSRKWSLRNKFSFHSCANFFPTSSKGFDVSTTSFSAAACSIPAALHRLFPDKTKPLYRLLKHVTFSSNFDARNNSRTLLAFSACCTKYSGVYVAVHFLAILVYFFFNHSSFLRSSKMRYTRVLFIFVLRASSKTVMLPVFTRHSYTADSSAVNPNFDSSSDSVELFIFWTPIKQIVL